MSQQQQSAAAAASAASVAAMSIYQQQLLASYHEQLRKASAELSSVSSSASSTMTSRNQNSSSTSSLSGSPIDFAMSPQSSSSPSHLHATSHLVAAPTFGGLASSPTSAHSFYPASLTDGTVSTVRTASPDNINLLAQLNSSGPQLSSSAMSTPTSHLPQHYVQWIRNTVSVGGSCHQCKTSKHDRLLYCCAPMIDGRQRCRKKYCDGCLKKHYNISVANIRGDALATWVCPSCQNSCTCATCKRKGTEKKQRGRKRIPKISTATGEQPQQQGSTTEDDEIPTSDSETGTPTGADVGSNNNPVPLIDTNLATLTSSRSTAALTDTASPHSSPIHGSTSSAAFPITPASSSDRIPATQRHTSTSSTMNYPFTGFDSGSSSILESGPDSRYRSSSNSAVSSNVGSGSVSGVVSTVASSTTSPYASPGLRPSQKRTIGTSEQGQNLTLRARQQLAALAAAQQSSDASSHQQQQHHHHTFTTPETPGTPDSEMLDGHDGHVREQSTNSDAGSVVSKLRTTHISRLHIPNIPSGDFVLEPPRSRESSRDASPHIDLTSPASPTSVLSSTPPRVDATSRPPSPSARIRSRSSSLASHPYKPSPGTPAASAAHRMSMITNKLANNDSNRRASAGATRGDPESPLGGAFNSSSSSSSAASSSSPQHHHAASSSNAGRRPPPQPSGRRHSTRPPERPTSAIVQSEMLSSSFSSSSSTSASSAMLPPPSPMTPLFTPPISMSSTTPSLPLMNIFMQQHQHHSPQQWPTPTSQFGTPPFAAAAPVSVPSGHHSPYQQAITIATVHPPHSPSISSMTPLSANSRSASPASVRIHASTSRPPSPSGRPHSRSGSQSSHPYQRLPPAATATTPGGYRSQSGSNLPTTGKLDLQAAAGRRGSAGTLSSPSSPVTSSLQQQQQVQQQSSNLITPVIATVVAAPPPQQQQVPYPAVSMAPSTNSRRSMQPSSRRFTTRPPDRPTNSSNENTSPTQTTATTIDLTSSPVHGSNKPVQAILASLPPSPLLPYGAIAESQVLLQQAAVAAVALTYGTKAIGSSTSTSAAASPSSQSHSQHHHRAPSNSSIVTDAQIESFVDEMMRESGRGKTSSILPAFDEFTRMRVVRSLEARAAQAHQTSAGVHQVMSQVQSTPSASSSMMQPQPFQHFSPMMLQSSMTFPVMNSQQLSMPMQMPLQHSVSYPMMAMHSQPQQPSPSIMPGSFQLPHLPSSSNQSDVSYRSHLNSLEAQLAHAHAERAVIEQQQQRELSSINRQDQIHQQLQRSQQLTHSMQRTQHQLQIVASTPASSSTADVDVMLEANRRMQEQLAQQQRELDSLRLLRMEQEAEVRRTQAMLQLQRLQQQQLQLQQEMYQLQQNQLMPAMMPPSPHTYHPPSTLHSHPHHNVDVMMTSAVPSAVTSPEPPVRSRLAPLSSARQFGIDAAEQNVQRPMQHHHLQQQQQQQQFQHHPPAQQQQPLQPLQQLQVQQQQQHPESQFPPMPSFHPENRDSDQQLPPMPAFHEMEEESDSSLSSGLLPSHVLQQSEQQQQALADGFLQSQSTSPRVSEHHSLNYAVYESHSPPGMVSPPGTLTRMPSATSSGGGGGGGAHLDAFASVEDIQQQIMSEFGGGSNQQHQNNGASSSNMQQD